MPALLWTIPALVPVAVLEYTSQPTSVALPSFNKTEPNPAFAFLNATPVMLRFAVFSIILNWLPSITTSPMASMSTSLLMAKVASIV